MTETTTSFRIPAQEFANGDIVIVSEQLFRKLDVTDKRLKSQIRALKNKDLRRKNQRFGAFVGCLKLTYDKVIVNYPTLFPTILAR